MEERRSRNEELGTVSYETSPVVPITLKTYIEWLERAAGGGDLPARLTLSHVYQTGEPGVPKDLVRSYMWVELTQGTSSSMGLLLDMFASDEPFGFSHELLVEKTREELTAELSETQIAEAKRRAEVWKKAHTEKIPSE